MAVYQQCWEQCFQDIATEMNRPVLSEIFKTGSTLKRIKNVNSANGISFLIDSTIATQCDESSSQHVDSHHHGRRSSKHRKHSSSSSESLEDVLQQENATAIFQMQLQMMAILATMVGAPKVFPVQFNERAAWYIKEYECLDYCGTIKAVQSGLFSPVQVNSTSCKSGLLEPACHAAYNALNNPPSTCLVSKNNLTVAILNSNAHSHVHKKGNYKDYSPCHTFFNLRYALGTHNTPHDDLVRFQSRDDYHNYMPDNLIARNAVDSIFNCMSTRCCATLPSNPNPTTGKVFFGDAGETSATISAINPISF